MFRKKDLCLRYHRVFDAAVGGRSSAPGACFPLLQVLNTFSDPVLGDPVAFALSAPIPGSDASPMTLPVYIRCHPDLTFLPGQSSVQTVMASAVSSGPEGCPPVCHGHLMFLGRAHLTLILLRWILGIATCSRRACRAVVLRLTLARQLHIRIRRLACSFITPGFWSLLGLPESARLLYHSPEFWIQLLGEEDALEAAVGLQRDAGIMLSNLQILSQFVTSLHRMSSEMLALGIGRVVFPAEEVAALSTTPRAPRAAEYMAAMGLWRPQAGSGDPGPVPASSCNTCMNCRYCFPEGPVLPESDSSSSWRFLGRYGSGRLYGLICDSLQLTVCFLLSGSLFGDSGVLGTIVYMFVLSKTVCLTDAVVLLPSVARSFGGPDSYDFSGLPSCIGYFRNF